MMLTYLKCWQYEVQWVGTEGNALYRTKSVNRYSGLPLSEVRLKSWPTSFLDLTCIPHPSRKRYKGLRQLFPGQVQIYTLDPNSTKRRGVRDAQELYLGYDQLEVEDIMLVRNELNLSEASLENAIILRNEFGRSWITQLLTMSNEEIDEFCESKRGNKSSIMALQRKLMRLEELPYMRSSCPRNYVDQILESLSAGKHVVIEFGSQSNMLSYMKSNQSDLSKDTSLLCP